METLGGASASSIIYNEMQALGYLNATVWDIEGGTRRNERTRMHLDSGRAIKRAKERVTRVEIGLAFDDQII